MAFAGNIDKLSKALGRLDADLGFTGQRAMASMPSYHKAVAYLTVLFPHNEDFEYAYSRIGLCDQDLHELRDWVERNRERHPNVWQIGTPDEIEPPRCNVEFNYYMSLHQIDRKLSSGHK